MSESAENNIDDDAKSTGDANGARVRFKGIVESGPDGIAHSNDFNVLEVTHRKERWNAISRQVWLLARLCALFLFITLVLGVPLGNFFAHLTLTGSTEGWSWIGAYDLNTLISAIIVPVLILLMGYMLSRQFTMLNAAESIAAAAQQMATPDLTAAYNADSVGAVVRGHVSALNDGLDGALGRLATVEAQIRQHVEAIEIAGDAIEQKATGAVTRVADERTRLMELTETLNAHADSFAAAIAERAQASIEALERADTVPARLEKDFDNRLVKLETAAHRAVSSFEALCAALGDADQTLRENAANIDEAAAYTSKATERANAASNAAAESAALNAANVAASANRAADIARTAAEEAIETARSEAEAITEAALETASEKSAIVQDTTAKVLGDMSSATKAAVERARKDASLATKAAEDVSKAAKVTSDAARQAATEVAAASEGARKNSEDALNYSKTATARIEERNQALTNARAALEKENTRLEKLIEEQRNRADRIADAIASQTERLSKLAEVQLREQEASARLAEANRELQDRANSERQKEEALQAEKRAEVERKAALERQKAEKDAARELKIEKEQADRNATKTAKAPLELKLVDEKRKNAERLDELADEIAHGRNRVARTETSVKPTAPKRTQKSKRDVSWREILDAAEDSEPLDLGAAAKKTPAQARDAAAGAIHIIAGLQNFTHDLETRLYGTPPPALQERFESGDRNVFANRILRLNEADVKRRIRSESARDRKFEKSVHAFLQNFEKLLEDATTSETADEELEEYLSSPLGRVYLLIGATVGYFA